MKAVRSVVFGTASFLPLGCADGAVELMPAEAARWDQAAVAGPTDVSGSYDAVGCG